MKHIEHLDLTMLKSGPDISQGLFKQWIRSGETVLVLCHENQIEKTFQVLHIHVADNMFILYLAGQPSLQNYSQKMTTWFCSDQKFVRCPAYSAGQKYPKDMWGFLFYTAAIEKMTYSLPVSLFAKLLPPSYNVHSHVYYEGRYLFILMPETIYKGSRIGIHIGDNGCTASIIAIPVLKHMVNQYKDLQYAVELRYAPQCDFYDLYSLLIDGADHCMEERDLKKRSLCHMLQYDRETAAGYKRIFHYGFVQSWYQSPYKSCHVFREVLAMSGMEDTEDAYEKLIREYRLPNALLSNRIMKEIDTLRRNSKGLIAIQFSCFTDFEHAYDADHLIRRWPLHFIQILVNQCKAYGYQVLNLTPLTGKLTDVLDYSYLNMGELAGIIRQVDIVVGIDHFCCQLAGILNIPNISVYRSGVHTIITSPNGGKNLCFRPVNRNISLIEPDDGANTATIQRIVSLLVNFFRGKLSIPAGLIRYQDTQDGINVYSHTE